MKQLTVTQKVSIGTLISLAGAALIWLGDGGESLLRKAVVVAGVILVIAGIGILRYLLFTTKKRINGR